MSEVKQLVIPRGPEEASVSAQLTTLFEEAAQAAGGAVFAHPEEHCFNVVFGGYQVTVAITERN